MDMFMEWEAEGDRRNDGLILYEKTVTAIRWKLIYIPLLTWRMTEEIGRSPWMNCWRVSTRHRHGNKSKLIICHLVIWTKMCASCKWQTNKMVITAAGNMADFSNIMQHHTTPRVKKTSHCTLAHNFAKCWPISKNFSQVDSAVNV